MSDLINIKINGNAYQVEAGMNLVDAADSIGVHIPNLCYLKGMRGIGACRVCMVEINGKMVTACTTKTKDGMDVVTENEKITEIRRFVIDLILSNFTVVHQDIILSIYRDIQTNN
jgi:NADP-reducing hydrogenase subunit HndD